MHLPGTHQIHCELLIFTNRLGNLRLSLHFVVDDCENEISLQSSRILVKNASITVHKFAYNSVLLVSVVLLD